MKVMDWQRHGMLSHVVVGEKKKGLKTPRPAAGRGSGEVVPNSNRADWISARPQKLVMLSSIDREDGRDNKPCLQTTRD
jgi:hypothetical protein